jgi:hypothetical protein
VAILALAPPWILIYLVSGKKGIRTGWPLAIVGSFGYIAGQFPVAELVGPYLPDITGAITSFVALLLLLRLWKPATVLGFGGPRADRGGDPRARARTARRGESRRLDQPARRVARGLAPGRPLAHPLRDPDRRRHLVDGTVVTAAEVRAVRSVGDLRGVPRPARDR